MKTKYLLHSILMLLILSFTGFSQEQPEISFEELMNNAEQYYKYIKEARELTLEQEVPFSIFLEEGIFIEAKAVENGKPVYAVIKNLLHPHENSDVMFYSNIVSSFNLDNARLSYSNGVMVNPSVGLQTGNNNENRNANFLLISESTNNRVMLFDFETGDLIDPEFIHSQSNFILPKQARQSPHTTISISDQAADAVFEYDTTGAFIRFFAPSIGPHTGILDNIRGHDYSPVNNHLFVCNAQGGNFNRVVEFDAMGNYIAQFFPDNSGGLLDPFDILIRANDVLVTGSTSGAAHRYDLNGNYLDDFATYLNFPQQIVEFPNGNIGVATFGSYQGGLKIYDPNGALVNDFNSVTGLRGVHYLGSGNIIVTNSAGVHEINGTTGDYVRTVAAGVSAQYINSCDFFVEVVPVELVSFDASVVSNSVSLFWVTASEINNSGFEVQRKAGSRQSTVGNSDFEPVGFVEGNGTSTEQNYYSFQDNNLSSGKYFYRLKQLDFDGTFEYSHVVEVEVNIPAEFSLSQNYPNPFNPTTKISFSIPQSSYVTLKVYDAIGNEIELLVNEQKESGGYEVDFNAGLLSSGIYFYSITAGNFKAVRKMTIIK